MFRNDWKVKKWNRNSYISSVQLHTGSRAQTMGYLEYSQQRAPWHVPETSTVEKNWQFKIGMNTFSQTNWGMWWLLPMTYLCLSFWRNWGSNIAKLKNSLGRNYYQVLDLALTIAETASAGQIIMTIVSLLLLKQEENQQRTPSCSKWPYSSHWLQESGISSTLTSRHLDVIGGIWLFWKINQPLRGMRVFSSRSSSGKRIGFEV